MADLALFDLTGKKALVTGGAMGIGRALCLALSRAGANVAIVDVNEQAGKATSAELCSAGGNAFFVHCDVTSKADIDRALARIVEEFGQLDIAVNNAGISRVTPDETTSEEDWAQVIALNLSATFFCCQAEARQMLTQQPMGGKIVNIASMSASIANVNASYCASKAGVVHMSRSLAAQWGKYNINVNCISPTYVMSSMHGGTPAFVRNRMRELHPLGYLARPRDLWGAVIFFASEASSYITGQDLVVDGGHTLNVWLAPLKRVAPAKVDPAQEVEDLKHDLSTLGIEYTKEGVVPAFISRRKAQWERLFGGEPKP